MRKKETDSFLQGIKMYGKDSGLLTVSGSWSNERGLLEEKG